MASIYEELIKKRQADLDAKGQNLPEDSRAEFLNHYIQNRQKQEASMARGQQLVEAQRARDTINQATSNTAATYDFAHGQLPSISNAQAFQNAQRQTSLDDSLNQIMGNNVLTDAGRVSKAQEAYSSILSAPTVSATPTAQEVANAYRQSYANFNTPMQKAVQAVDAYKTEREQQNLERNRDVGSQRRIHEIRNRLSQEKDRQENARKDREEIVNRLAEINRELEADPLHTGLFPELEAEKAELEKRLAENDTLFANGGFDNRINALNSQLDEALKAQYASIPYAPDFAERSQSVRDSTKTERINPLTREEYDRMTPEEQMRYRMDHPWESQVTLSDVLSKNGDPFFDPVDAYSHLEYMTDAQRGTYNYLYNTSGADAANEYLERMRPQFEAQMAQNITERTAEYAENHPVISSAESVLSNIGKAPAAVANIANSLAGNETNPNAWYNRAVTLTDTTRSTVGQKFAENAAKKFSEWGASDEASQFAGNTANFLYGTGLSMIDSMVNAAIGSYVTGASALNPAVNSPEEIKKVAEKAANFTRTLMALEATPSALIEAKERGLSDTQAMTIGLIAGAAEYITEKWSLENLFSADWEENTLKNLVKQVFSESSEEGASNLINLFTDILVAGDKSDWRKTVNEYKSTGDNDKQAFWHTMRDKAIDLGVDMLGGAISGGGMGAGRVVGGAVNNAQYRVHNQMRTEGQKQGGVDYLGDMTRLAENAMNLATDSAEQIEALHTLNDEMERFYPKDTTKRTIDFLVEGAKIAQENGDGETALNYKLLERTVRNNQQTFTDRLNQNRQAVQQTAQTETAEQTAAPSTAQSTESSTPSIQATTAEHQAITNENQAETAQTAQNVSQTSEEAPVAENAVETNNNTSAENNAQRGSENAAESTVQNEPGYRPSERRVGAAAFGLSEDMAPDQAASTILRRVIQNAKDPMVLAKSGVRKAAIDGLNASVNNAIQSGQYTAEEVEALKSYTNQVRDALRNSNDTLQKTLNATSAVLKRYGVKNIKIDETLTDARGYHKGDTIYVNPYLDTMQSVASVIAHETFHQARMGDKSGKLLDDIDKYYTALAGRSQNREDTDGQFSVSNTGGRVNLYTDAQFVRTYADKIWEEFSPTEAGEAALNAYYEQHRDTTMEEAIAAVYEADPEKFWSDYWKPSESGETARDYIREEKAANFIEQLAGTDGGALFRELVRDDRNLAQRIIDTIRNFLKLPAKERRFEGAEAYQRLADKFEKALADASGEEQQRAEMTAATAEDIPDSGKFSLSRPVERVGDLIAVHNLTEDKYLSTHKLGGFPAPSIAVVKAKTGHENYGPISVVFGSDTIDPQKDSRNRIFGGDAWTPMFPDVKYDYKVSGVENLEQAIYKLAQRSGGYGKNLASPGGIRSLFDEIMRWGDSPETALDTLGLRRDVQAAYLAAQGEKLKANDKFAAFAELDKRAPADKVKAWLRPAIEQIAGEGALDVAGERVPLTAENVVRAMYENRGSRGIDIYEADANGLRSMAAPEYQSIDEVRQNRDKLKRLDDKEYQKIVRRLDGYIGSIMDEMREFNGDRSGLDYDKAILDALRNGGTEENIRDAFEDAGIGINNKLTRDVRVIYNLASQLPTDYFEAKPERVVGFDEVMYYIIPNDIAPSTAEMMENDGATVLGYTAGDEKERLKVLNSLKNARFSREINTEQTETEAFKRWFGDWQNDPENASKVVNEDGTPKIVYHGTARGDRVGNVFLPERATSGPMAYFTDSEQIASNYARDKADTSLAYDEDHDGSYESQFRVQDKDRSIRLVDAWNRLKMRDRLAIREAVKHVTWDEDMENIVYDEDAQAGTGGLQDWRFRERNGNAIAALVDEWLNDGNLYGNEGDFMEAVRLAGIPEALERAGLGEAYYDDPNFRDEKVYGVYLNIRNPLVTTELDESFADALEEWWDEQDEDAYRREYNRADEWDKNRWDMYDWIDLLRSDIENGTTHVWTSIPDAVTDFLKSEGYDGIEDQGGKLHDEGHTVYIPFESTQIKSATDNIGTFDPNNPDIRYSREITPEQDAEYMEAVENGDMETAARMVQEDADRSGYGDAIPEQAAAYTLRTKAAPKKTVKVYKVFTVAPDGSPTALFVSSATKLPQNVWLEAVDTWHFTADNGKQYVPSTQNPYTDGGKTGASVTIPNEEIRQELIKRGYLPKNSKAKKVTALAYRPGWHAGDLPFFPQGGKQGNPRLTNQGNINKEFDPTKPETNYENIHRYNQVVFECEMAADTDYTETARNQDKVWSAKGTFMPKMADLQYMPTDGYYKYTTNPTMTDVGNWMISGSLKINRALTQEECDAILTENGYKPQEWEGGTLDLESLGYTGEQYDAAKKTLAPVTYDDDGNVIPLSQRFNPEINDVRYSREVSTEQDQEYMDAVESGDEETQNRIIEEAAKAAGYNYRGYHGTNRKFTTFIPGYATGWGKGIYVASNAEDAENYGSNVMPVYLKMENPYTGQKINAENTQAYKKYVEDYYKKIARNEDITVEEAMQNRQKPTVMDMVNDEDVNYLNAALRELGYDGIIMEGSNDITGTEMVVFDPSQVKSANPVTYDDDGNVIPPSQRFNPERDDIRESRDIEETSNADLKRMLRESEEKVEYLKKQWTARTAFGAAQAVKPEDFNKQVRRLKGLMQYSIVTTDEIRNGLRELYNIMERPLKGRNDTAESRWNEAAAKAEELANEWAGAAAMERVINPDIADNLETYKDIYSKLRGYSGFYVLPEMTAEAGDKESLRRLRKQLSFMHLLGVDSNKAGVESGRMSIDAIYFDLSRSYPAFFGEESELSGGELNGDYAKLQAIADVAGLAWEAAHDPYSIEQTVDEQSVKTQLKDDLLHSFFDVATPTKASVRPTENDAREAYAQGQAELGAVAESEHEEGYREGYNKAKFEDEGAVEAAHMREDLMEQRFAEDAERFQNTMRKMLNEREEKINRLEKRLIKRGWADRARIERNGVMRNLNKLNRLLENPTRKQHIPQGLRASTAKLLETVGNTRLPNGKTVVAGRMQQIQVEELEKMRNFAHEIQIGLTGAASAENSNRIASTEGFMLQLADKINALEDYYNRAIGPDVDMSLRTDDAAVTQNYGFLHSLNQILTMAVHALDDANQFTIQGKNYTAENLGSLLVGDLNGRESEGYGRQNRKLGANLSDRLRNMTYETMSADLFFGMMGDNWKNIVAHSYREGQNRQAQHEHQYIEYMKELLGDYDNMKAKRELIQITANGKPLNVTRSQLMQLYATYQRPAGRTHLENGGACFVDDRGNESRAYTVKITSEKFAELTSHLTDEDKRIADGLVKFMADECSEWGNDASMYMYGFRMYEDGSYIPLDVVNYAIPKEIADKIQKTKSIENASFTNPLKRNSVVPLRMTDIFDIANNHVRRMAAYNAYAPITNDMNRIMKLSDVSGTVQEKMGRRGYKYLQDFVQTVAANEVRNGEMAESAAPLTTAMNLYKRQAVAWNVSTMLKQPISIFRAANEIDGKYIRQALALGKDEYRRIKETMLNNSGVAYLKENGYSDVGLGKTMEKLYTKNYINDAGLLRGSLAENKVGRGLINAYDWMTEKGMAGAGRADESTWVRIWKACELEVAENHPGMTADEKLRLVTQRFNDVIGKTQVVDTVLDTAPLMRNKAMQIFTPFMNEPTKTLGGLVAAVDAVRNNKNGAKKALGKAIGLYALSNLLIEPLVTSFVSMWRDEKDDTENFWWSLLEKMFGIKRDEDGDGKNDTTVGSVFTSNVASGLFSFPVINIFYDAISNGIQGFDSEKIDVAALSNIVSSSVALVTNAGKEPDDRQKTMYRLWGDWAESIAAAAGVPAKTVRRQIAGTVRGIMDITNSDWAKWQYNKLYYNLDNASARSQKNFYDILASAYKRGDMEAYEAMRKELGDIVTGTPSLVSANTIQKNIEKRGGEIVPGTDLWNLDVQSRFRLDTPVKGWKVENFLTGVYKAAEKEGVDSSVYDDVLLNMPSAYDYDGEDGEIEMTADQYDTFTRNVGSLSYKILSELSASANADRWEKLNIDQKLHAIQKVYAYAKAKNKKDIYPDYNINGQGKWMAELYDKDPNSASAAAKAVLDVAEGYKEAKKRAK